MKYALCLTFFTTATAAHAFTLSGTNPNVKGWKTSEIEFRLNPSNCPAEVDSLLNDAIDIWNTIPTSHLEVKRGSDTSVGLAELSNRATSEVPAIVCSTNVQSEAGLDPNAIPGVAMGFSIGGDNHINYGYIVLNVQEGAAANISNIDSERVKAIIAHEIGHVLGLGHSEDTAALMYYDVTAKKELSLAQDDVDGFTYLYPRDELQGDDLLGGCGVLGGGQTAMHLWVALIAMLLPLLLLFSPKKAFDLNS